MKRVLAALTLVLAVAAATVAIAPAGSAQNADQRQTDDTRSDRMGDVRPTDRPTDRRAHDRVEPLRLECRLVATDEGRGVGCDWSSAEHPLAEAYVLVRAVNGGERTIVYRGPAPEPSRFVDLTAVPGTRMVYRVVAVSHAGRIVGESRPDVVAWPVDRVRDAEVTDSAG